VAAEEHPVAPSGYFAAQPALADVVTERQSTIVEESLQRDPLIARVADRLGHGRVVKDLVDLGITPLEETLDDGPDLAGAYDFAFAPRCIRDSALDAEQLANECERLASSLGVGFEGLPVISSRVRPTGNFNDIAAAIQVVVDGMGVGDQVALVSA